MKKIIVITCMGLFFCFFGCKRWTVDEAKHEAFSRIPARFDISNYLKHDPNFEVNQEALKKGQKIVDDRFITRNPEPPIGYVVSHMIRPGSQSLF